LSSIKDYDKGHFPSPKDGLARMTLGGEAQRQRAPPHATTFIRGGSTLRFPHRVEAVDHLGLELLIAKSRGAFAGLRLLDARRTAAALRHGAAYRAPFARCFGCLDTCFAIYIQKIPRNEEAGRGLRSTST